MPRSNSHWRTAEVRFGAGLFPFEAISILLLVAVVGAIAIARPLHEDAVPADPNNPNDPAVEGHSV